ncbi:MFS transporter [Streptomyces sp. AVP053U2]|uniref:MFS transporter n=1 Tax=unclassified Streptomyces TaxID=2593676 RepID=UPI000B2434E2|nr:MFS transporter [Streptomyces sp. AVP053U2]
MGGIGGIAGALSGDSWQRRFSLRSVLVGGLFGWAALISVMALARQPLVLGVLFTGTGYITGVFNVAAAVHQVRTTPDALQGRVAGTSHLIATGANVLGVLLGGLTLSSWSASLRRASQTRSGSRTARTSEAAGPSAARASTASSCPAVPLCGAWRASSTVASAA